MLKMTAMHRGMKGSSEGGRFYSRNHRKRDDRGGSYTLNTQLSHYNFEGHDNIINIIFFVFIKALQSH